MMTNVTIKLSARQFRLLEDTFDEAETGLRLRRANVTDLQDRQEFANKLERIQSLRKVVFE